MSRRAIQHQDPTGDGLLARWPGQGTAAIRPGSELAVEEGQQAFVVRDGRALDSFGPGRHSLSTDSLPLLAALDLPGETEGPLEAAVVFVSEKRVKDLKWGTPEPLVYHDPERGAVRLCAFGTLAVRIDDVRGFVERAVGGTGIDSDDRLTAWCRDVVVGRLSDLLAETRGAFLDRPSPDAELATVLEARVAIRFAAVALDLARLAVGEINPL